MPLSVQDKIDIGGLSSLYASNDLASGKINGGAQDKRLPFLIWAFTEGLTLMQEYSYPTEDTDKVGNYLLSICRDQLKAEAELELNNGGTVAPITPNQGGDNIFPIKITQASFTFNATSGKWEYLNDEITGYNVSMFINEWAQQYLFAPDAFTYISGGLQMELSGFDPANYTYTGIIDKFNN